MRPILIGPLKGRNSQVQVQAAEESNDGTGDVRLS